MPHYSGTIAATASSEANAQAWVQSIHDALAGCGLVQTSDTGQVVISAITIPSIPSTIGYEVWRFDDALQSTAPLFIVVTYSVGASSTSNVQVQFGVGTGTDGAGALTGVVFSPSSFSSTATNTAAAGIYSTGDGSGVAVCSGIGLSAAKKWMFLVDRSRDSSGNATDDGVAVIINGNLNDAECRVKSFNSTAYSSTPGTTFVAMPVSFNGAAISTGSTLSPDGVRAPVVPISFMAPDLEPWTTPLIVACAPADGALTMSATVAGGTHVYRQLDSAVSTATAVSGVWGIGLGQVASTPLVWPCLLWED